MKSIFRSIAVTGCLLFAVYAKAQVTGVNTVPGTFATIEAAITALNTNGVGAGGATINVAAGYTETPTTQLVLTMATNGPTAANPLIIQKSGAGANPLITAPTPGVSTTLDGIFILNGADYVTIDGIDLQENPANTTPTMQMEWGYALLKTGVGNGSQNNTIKNCSVTLSNANTASCGMYIGNHLTTSTTALVVNTNGGTSSNNRFFNNTIMNAYLGYSITGYASAAPYDYYDQGNQIGKDGVSTRQSAITNFGGGTAAAYGVICSSQNGLRIFGTNITGGTGTTNTTMGINISSGFNANIDIYSDTVTISSAATTQTVFGIQNAAGGTGSGNTINIYNNRVVGGTLNTLAGGEFRGISSTATASYTNMYGNTVTSVTLPLAAATVSGIYYSGSSSTLVQAVNIYNNTVTGITRSAASGNMYLIYASASTVVTNTYGNTLMNCNNSTSAAGTYGYYNFAVGLTENVYNNSVHDIAGGGGETTGLFVQSGTGNTNKDVYGNAVYNISGNSVTSTVSGMTTQFGTYVNVYRNNLYNITNNTAAGVNPAAAGIVFGISNNAMVTASNNFISDIRTPSANNTNAVYGIYALGSASSWFKLYYNTIYINASSAGLNFGTAAIAMGTTAVQYDLRNNILVNLSSSAGTGSTKALVRGSTALTNYSVLSGYNCLYAGAPSATNLLWSDGTNNYQTIASMQAGIGAREQASFSENPPFVNVAAAPYDLHLQNAVPTGCSSGGGVVSITIDYDNTPRGATPDVGADEFTGLGTDNAGPNIVYTTLGTGVVAPTRVLTSWATITDPSGVNTTPGTRPRIYYKKSTNANAFNSNTNVTDGWKYVEASNAASPFSFTIDYSLLFGGAGVANGDIIQYFVIAQDMDASVMIGTNAAGYPTTPGSVNLTGADFPVVGLINQYPIVSVGLSGTINVGPTELVTSLTNAGGIFQAINASTLTGNLIINITGDLTAETGTFALNQWSEDGVGNYTVTIQPSAAVVRNIYGSNAAAALIRFDGADRVNIDGRFGGTGQYLMFRNTSNTAQTMSFINDASNNTVQYCILESGNTSTSTTLGGNLFIGGTTGSTGNDNITISNCDIRDRSDIAGTSAMGIYCIGNNTGGITLYNENCVFTNNTIHDWFLVNSGTQYGMFVSTGNTGFTITGNSFYQTATRTATTGTTSAVRCLIINQSVGLNTIGGYTITGNFFGGTAPGATGGDMTYTTSGTATQTFGAISIGTGLIPTSIQNNIIRKIDYTSQTPTAPSTMWFGINISQGIFNVGTTTGNVIGDAAAANSIKITMNTGGTQTTFLAGILCAPVNGYATLNNNTVAGINMSGTNTSTAVIPQWIQIQGTPNANTTVNNNTIGSTTVPNSIVNNMTTAPCVQFCVRHVITSAAGISITNNTIQGITDNGTSATSAMYGILMVSGVGGSGTMNLNNNTIRDIQAAMTPAAPVLACMAISIQGQTGTTHTFNNNLIQGIRCVSTGAFNGYSVGIQTQGNLMGGTMNQNRIYDITNANTGTGPGTMGIYISAGYNWTISNNMISMLNIGFTNLVEMDGILDYMGAGTTLNLYYNSIFVGGSATSGALNTTCYGRGGNTNVTLRNNLLYNKRTGGTGAHVAIVNGSATPTTGWTPSSSNYNAFVVADTTRVGVWNLTTTNMSGFRALSGGEMNSIWETSGTITNSALWVNSNNANLHINTSTYPEALGTPVAGITVDYDGNARSATFPTIGADELACSNIVFTATSVTNVTCAGGNNGAATVGGTGGNGITYSWAPSGGTAASATGLTAGTYSVTVSNICGNSAVVTVTITQPTTLSVTATQTDVACNGNTSGSATASVTGGTPTYTYLWSSGGTAATENNLGAGSYTVTITDANSCTTTQTYTITEPTVLNAIVISTNVSCNGGNNGDATAMPSGGVSPYTYSWSSGGTNAMETGLAAGSYTVTTTDANGCTRVDSVTIAQPTVIASSMGQNNTSCNGTSDGDATVTPTGGTPGYTYLWTSGGTAATETNLAAGTYTVTVTDANGCTHTNSVTITEPAIVDGNATSSNPTTC